MLAATSFSTPQLICLNDEGTPCFHGTQVPLRSFLDHLERGFTLYEFLLAFPVVRRDQVIAFLELAAARLVESSN